jgi:DNA-binding XRE family transcriptional regulator
MDTDELKRAFGRRVQGFREQNGLTQEQLAEKIDRTVDTVGNIERGATSTQIETAASIARVFRVEIAELFEFEAAPATGRQRRKELTELTGLILDLDDRQFGALAALIRNAITLARGSEQTN